MIYCISHFWHGAKYGQNQWNLRIILLNRHLVLIKCDKYETTPLGSISHSSGTNLQNMKLAASGSFDIQQMCPRLVWYASQECGFIYLQFYFEASVTLLQTLYANKEWCHYEGPSNYGINSAGYLNTTGDVMLSLLCVTSHVTTQISWLHSDAVMFRQHSGRLGLPDIRGVNFVLWKSRK